MTRRPLKPGTEPLPRTQLVNDFPIADLIVNPRNPRTHPELQLTRLMASLARDGQTKPVLVRRENSMLIAGHGVTEAARRSGWTTIVALLWDVDQATADRVMLADNQFSELSSSDKTRVSELLSEIDQLDYVATGFSDEEVAKLLTNFEDSIEVVAIETTTVTDDFWVTCRGPLARQAEVLSRIKQLLAEYTEVTIELGVVAGL